MKKVFSLCPLRHILLLISALLIGGHLLLRQNREMMRLVSRELVQPLNQFASTVTAWVPFSLAELLIAVLVLGFAANLVCGVYRALKTGKIGPEAYKLLLTALSMVAGVYALFCLLWGCYFYDEGFAGKSGLDDSPISVQELETVTAYFAGLANHYSTLVEREENGCYTTDRAAILEKSRDVYRELEKQFPCLAGPEVKVKGIQCSRIMSLLDFTGFYFPITGEANVNMDFPPSLFASTVAHEISHQRGVCREQEANFLAVLSSLEYGDADYCYSACLLAYTHLGNALYQADYEAWERVYTSLAPEILQDFACNRAYWARYETPVQTVSNTVYENFMYSYDQKLGLKSYGACVDLLVNYYYEKAVDSP